MDTAELRKMRAKQFTYLNALLIAVFALYFILMYIFEARMSLVFFVLAVLLLTQAIHVLLKGDSTRSWTPIVEQVASYERQQMGNEWIKQRRVVYVLHFLLSGLFFWQSYNFRTSSDLVFELDFKLMLLMVLFLGAMVNVTLFLHNKKIDRASLPSDLKGYTWKSTFIGVAVGVVIGMTTMMLIVFYVLTTI